MATLKSLQEEKTSVEKRNAAAAARVNENDATAKRLQVRSGTEPLPACGLRRAACLFPLHPLPPSVVPTSPPFQRAARFASPACSFLVILPPSLPHRRPLTHVRPPCPSAVRPQTQIADLKRSHAREEATINAKFEGLREAVRTQPLELLRRDHRRCGFPERFPVRLGVRLTAAAVSSLSQMQEYHMQLAAAIDMPLSARDLNVQ